MTKPIIGIDISKDQLDAALPGGAQSSFSNDAAGVAALIAELGAAPARVVFEATGRYHAALERGLAAAGHEPVKVNPLQARRFAQALGVRAKTDRADAAMLARMGAALELQPTPVAGKVLTDLRALKGARQALIKDRTAARNRMQTLPLPLLRAQNTKRLAQIEADLRAIDHAMSELIDGDPALARRREILRSIPGISAITSAAMVVMLPELGRLEGRQIAKLAGLAPITRQSGRWQGKAFIQGGRSDLRQALYMPAVSALRHNPDMARFAQRLKERGKPGKLVVTAVMRKLLVTANVLLSENRKWVPRRA